MIVCKKKLVDAWNKYPPSKLERFFYKHFREESGENYTLPAIAFILLSLFLMGFISTVFDENKTAMVATYGIGILLICLAVPWIYVWYSHNRRIKKIIKELGCTRKEYDKAVDMWGKYIK
jgi:TM2 domain-containing membrane protein YozV